MKEIVKTLLCGIVPGRNLTIACQYPHKVHCITGRVLSSSGFFRELALEARARGIIVLEFDGDEVECGDFYLPSYHLAKRALELDVFSNFHKELEKALEARELSNGPKLLAKIVRDLNLPTMAILKNIHWELDGRTESTFVYGEETHLLGEAMSVVFDIWHGDAWRRIENHIHYFVDEMGDQPYLHNGKLPI